LMNEYHTSERMNDEEGMDEHDGVEVTDLKMRLHLITAYAKSGQSDTALSSFIALLPSLTPVHSSFTLETTVCSILSCLSHHNDRSAIRSLLDRVLPILPPSSTKPLSFSILLPLVVQSFPPSSLLSLLPSRPLSVLTDVATVLPLLAEAAIWREQVIATEGMRGVGRVSHQMEVRGGGGGGGGGETKVREEWEKRVIDYYQWVKKKIDRASRGNAEHWTGQRERWDDEVEDEHRPMRRAISLSAGGLRLQAMYHHVLCFIASSPSSVGRVKEVVKDGHRRVIPLLPETW
jgi:hypothetical protein